MAGAIADTFYDVYKTTVNEFGVSNRKSKQLQAPPGAEAEAEAEAEAGAGGDNSGGNSVFDAAKGGLVEALNEAASAGGPDALGARDNGGHTPAHWACLRGQLQAVRCIAQHGQQLCHLRSSHELGQFPLHWAAVNGHVDIMEFLLQLPCVDIDARDAKGCTALLTACQYGHTVTAGYLMGRGANRHLLDNEGDSALHWAAFKGQPDLMRLLVYAGCDPHLVDGFGQTPLHLACISGNLTCVRDLCRVDKVQVNVADRNGKTPLMLAAGRQHTSVETFLKEEIRGRASLLGASLKWRHLVFGPPGNSRIPMLFFIFCVVFWGYPCYVLKAVPLTWHLYPGLHLAFLLCNLAMWLCFYHANMKDPGYLPRNVPEYDRAILQSGSNAAQLGLGRVGNPLERLCHTCRTVKPLRSKHCRICDRCVREMDHHCPYIYNCIGYYNRYWFAMMTVTMMTNGAMTFAFAYLCLRLGGFDSALAAGVCLAGLGMAVGTIVTGCVWYNAARNLTTNESMNKRRYAYLQDADGKFKNPFDRGPLLNLLEFCHLRRSRQSAEVWDSSLQV